MPTVATGQITIVDTNDGVSLQLDRPAFVAAVAADGTALAGSYTGCDATAKVYLGSTDDTANWTITCAPSAGITGSKTGNTYTVTAMSTDSGEVVFSATRNGYPTLTTTFDVTKAKAGAQGAPGVNVATVYIYQRHSSSTALSKPTLNATYTFATGAVANLNNGWSATIPAGDAAKPFLQVSTATAANTGTTDTITPSEWSTVVVLAQDGTSVKGDTGERGAGWYYATGDAWTDAAANAATPGNNVVGDTVTISNAGGTFSGTRRWDGASWYVPGKHINGDLFVDGTINGAALKAGTVELYNQQGVKMLSLSGLQSGFEAPNTKNADLVPSITAASLATFTPFKVWDFKNTTEDWTGLGATVAALSDSIRVTSAGGDPIVYSPACSFNGGAYDRIRMKVKRTAGSSWDGCLYYFNVNHGDDGGYYVDIADATKLNEWVILEWDMAKSTYPADWYGNNVTRLRIDLGASSADVFEIDWIMVGKVGAGVSLEDLANASGNATLNTPETSNLWTGGYVTTVSDGPNNTGAAVRRSAVNGESSVEDTKFLAIDRQRTYRVRFYARAGGNANGVLYHTLRQYTAPRDTGYHSTNGGYIAYQPSGAQPHAEWRLYEYFWQAGYNWQAGVTHARPAFLMNYAGNSGFWEIQGYTLEDVTDVLNLQTNTFIPYRNCVVRGNTAEKVGGIAAWDSQVKSPNGFSGGAMASAKVVNYCSLMVGLNTDPDTDASYTSLDYAFYLTDAGQLHIYESNVSKGQHGSYVPGDVLSVTYDGTYVRYYTNTLLVRTVAPDWKIDAPMFFDSSFYSVGAALSNMQFGPMAGSYVSSGKGDALNDDPMLENISAWVLDPEVVVGFGTTATGARGSTYFSVDPYQGGDVFVTTRRKHAIEPNRTYNLSANLYAAYGNDREFYVFVQFYDGNMNYVGHNVTGWGGSMSGYTYGGLPPTDRWSMCGGDFGVGTGRPIPSTVRFCVIGVWHQYSGSGGSSVQQASQDIRLRDVTQERDKLSKSASNLLGAPIIVQANGGIVSGSLTWNSSGERTGGYGVALTPKGIVGYNSAGRATVVVDAQTGDVSVTGEISGSLIKSSVMSVESARILTAENRLAPLTIYDVGMQHSTGLANLNVTLPVFYGMKYGAVNSYNARRFARYAMDVFIRASIHAYSAAEVVTIQVSYNGGGWTTIVNPTLSMYQGGGAVIAVRYTTIADWWDTVQFRAVTSNSASYTLTLEVQVFNFNSSGNTAGSNSGISAAPSTGSGTPPTEEPWCVDYETTMLSNGAYVRDGKQGDLVAAWNDDAAHPAIEYLPILAIGCGDEQSYKLTTAGGAQIIQSRSTPMTLRDGRVVTTDLMLHEDVLVNRSGALAWEPVIGLEDMGVRKVVKVNLGDRMYFAGMNPKATIATHNINYKP